MSTKAPKSQIEETRALADFALAQLVDQPLLHHVSPLLHRLALGEDESIPVAIDLDDLQRQRATDQPRHVGLLAGLVAASDLRHLRSGNEATHAVEVYEEAALVVIGHLGFDDLVGLMQLLQAPPALLLPRPVDADHRVTFRILWLHDEDQDGVADRQRLTLVGGQTGVLPGRDDAFRLGADVDENLLTVEVHDHPVHDVAILQTLVVVAGIVEKLLHERGSVELTVFSRRRRTRQRFPSRRRMRRTLRPLRQRTRQRRQPPLAARPLPPLFGSSARSRLYRPYGLPESEHAASFPELSPTSGPASSESQSD